MYSRATMLLFAFSLILIVQRLEIGAMSVTEEVSLGNSTFVNKSDGEEHYMLDDDYKTGSVNETEVLLHEEQKTTKPPKTSGRQIKTKHSLVVYILMMVMLIFIVVAMMVQVVLFIKVCDRDALFESNSKSTSSC